MEKSIPVPKIEQERLWGEDVDLFKARYAVKFLHNILKSIGLREIKDNDFYRALATYITSDEVSGIYDSLLPKAKRKKLAESRNYRTPPEIGEDDLDDCLIYPCRSILLTVTCADVGEIFAGDAKGFSVKSDGAVFYCMFVEQREKTAIDIVLA